MTEKTQDDSYHRPVLLDASLEHLNIKPDGVYVDVTFGGGGHSKAILKQMVDGRLIAFDQDPDAVANTPDDDRFTLVQQNFKFMKNWLRMMKIPAADGILADLGVSSHQFDIGERGFSIRFDGPLDMRMDQKRGKSAADIVNTYDEDALSTILHRYGECERSRPMARAIVGARPLHTTTDLKDAIDRFLPERKEHKVLAQVFQALRIEVNEEMDVLQELLQQSADVLKPGGRLVVISYHSLEDRLVKDFMRSGNFSGEPEKDFFGNLIRPMKPLQSKPILPSEEEIQINTRSRSAKMRVAEKL
ncbi:MAG: 16S rRNA (cytosine(1402)-N(4))-methyltransferase RsmH [Flavobacteriales bacterium]